MSLSSINDMDSHNLIIALYADSLESNASLTEPQFTITGNDYSTLTWTGTTMAKPTESQLIAKYNSTKTAIRDKLVRERRDKLLVDSDKYAVKDYPFRTKSKRDQWTSYRSNLRNLTDNLSSFTLDLSNFEISNFDTVANTHNATAPSDEGNETITFDTDDVIVDGKLIMTTNTSNYMLVGDGTSYEEKSPSQVRSALDLEVGTDVQAYDIALNALSGITPSSNKIPMFKNGTSCSLLDFKDQDNMISNSATAIPSQQSVKAYVDNEISNLIDTAPSTLNTLNELAAALGDDANFSSTITTSLGQKLVKSSNLSDLTSASTARTNLGLAIGSNVQAYNANLVPITVNPGSGTNLTSIGINGTNYSISSGSSALNDLSDVTISSVSSGQVLKYNGSKWVNDTDSTSSGGGGGSGSFTGLTVSAGGIACSSFLDIEGDIKMAPLRKIEWEDSNTNIYGTDTKIVVNTDDTLQLNATAKINHNSPFFDFYNSLSSGPELRIKATSQDASSAAKLTLVARNSYTSGYGWQINTNSAKLQFITDRTVKGTYNDMILELVGHSNPLLSSTNVQGLLSVANNATFSENLYLSEDKIIRWENNNTYISGNDTSITIDGDTNLNLSAETEIKLDSDKLLLQHNINGILDFEIKNTYSSGTGGSSALTMVSDGGSAAGDTWQIKCSKSQMFFYSDVTTKGTVTTNIMSLTNHTTQSSRKLNLYGKLEVSGGLSVDLGSDATADMFYRNSSGDFTRLAKGTAGQVLTMNSGATAPEWDDSSSGGVTISNNVNNRVLTGDGTNANAEANMTFTGSALNVVGTISCDTSLTIDSSVLDASDILHIQDITAGTATASKALVLNASKGVTGITTLGSSSLVCPSISTSSNSNLELDPNGSGVVVFKGNSTRGSGQIKLNCENNSHGIIIKGPPHSVSASYTLTLPDNDGNPDQVLKTDGSGNLSWTTVSGGGASALNGLSDVSISSLSSGQVLKYNGSNWVNDTDATGGGGGGGGLPSGVTYTGSGNTAIFDVTGNIRASQDITAFYSSDRRFKDNLVRISEPNEKIKKINGYEFDWNEKHEMYKNTHDVGVVAQEIEEVLPEVVVEREDGYKAVKYEKIIALLIESNKDLLRRVEELEEKIKKK